MTWLYQGLIGDEAEINDDLETSEGYKKTSPLSDEGAPLT